MHGERHQDVVYNQKRPILATDGFSLCSLAEAEDTASGKMFEIQRNG